MASSLRSLPDESLRRRLLEHGITSPLTPSTRGILIKKLNHALAASRKAAPATARARRSTRSRGLHTLSSDEDDDEDEDQHDHSLASSRAARDGQLPPARRRLSRGGGADEAAALTPADAHRRFFPARGRGGRAGAAAARPREDYDTGSDSDPAEAMAGQDHREAPRPRGAHADPLAPGYRLGAGHSHNHSAGAGQASRARASVSARGHLQNGRDWVDAGGGGVAESAAAAADTLVSQADGPSRLANGRHHHNSSAAECQGAEEEESTWHYKVPLLLLVLLAVFFGVVAALYVNMRVPLLPTLCSVPAMAARALASLSVPFSATPTPPPLPLPAPPDTQLPPKPSAPPPTPTENRFPVCSSTLKAKCLSVQAMALVQPVLGRLEEVVLPALHQQAGRHQCGEAPTKYLPTSALQDLLQRHMATSWSPTEGEKVVESLGSLVEWNPHWGLEAVRGGATGGEGGALLGVQVASQPTYILCHITTAIYSFLYLIMGLVTALVTAWLAFSCTRYYRWKAEEEKQQMYELVEQILEVLGGLGGASGKDFVAVNHVRDSLISPRDRRTKQHLWERAVAFINHNESRVRREIQAVGGEDCVVWRWASGVPQSHHSPGSSPGVDSGGGGGRPPPKVWQGPAFNTLSPHNVPNVSPTSCLKIRNMFDCDVEFGDSWPARIQDSILEKCEGISIVHVVVDRSSREGCVYLKCASLVDSGRAFRALHGWWYDGNLVTVKFLRDERYHQRFPSAHYATLRLHPSNNKRLSLQQQQQLANANANTNAAGQPETPCAT
ncbi:uncharacterized protein LOC126986499 [Eriocheir sinensis]|uniref:uncharacterized protein LOC126986499 n=1 Tax=Eriocheir sinensis TaxID=95602 RepID=UPI0021C8C0AB|nr:uncharacterized protein LOC126986499 [Eriocheir sinensis]XP_050698728.1 uncharacterized protein LOC126986499 [Eriocheir sinensis]XP_050698729.1 uncharacterized protein LOC126986499 [Eriocheir sinensis]XP_050698730.1 uncharacterized protein LOC126986499 [Eriocheir sinensis]XP_050698731.1 uncharacterized protein LOC126986499 [Eriocheir sinensis]XP_050698732.1 uncharacterized protein LOC126986499 [Eriocheir sinensis]XP_050698733.1 uncharacterized protein LOC126986499 [Eriocheir sinensis]XP_0